MVRSQPILDFMEPWLYLAIVFIWPNFGIGTKTKVVSQFIAAGLTDLQFLFLKKVLYNY